MGLSGSDTACTAPQELQKSQGFLLVGETEEEREWAVQEPSTSPNPTGENHNSPAVRALIRALDSHDNQRVRLLNDLFNLSESLTADELAALVSRLKRTALTSSEQRRPPP